MSSVKNLNINEKSFKKGKKFSLKKTALILFLAGTIAVAGLVGYSHVNSTIEENQIQTIMEYYGEDSQEIF